MLYEIRIIRIPATESQALVVKASSTHAAMEAVYIRPTVRATLAFLVSREEKIPLSPAIVTAIYMYPIVDEDSPHFTYCS